jgi:GH24 family phage-related lysozyme (muramidase)
VLDRPAAPSTAAPSGGRSDAQTFLKDVKRWEGEHRFMYVDGRGYVTTGIGHLLKNTDEALKLPWLHRGTGRPATPAEVRSAFERVAQEWADYKRGHPNGNGYGATHYADKSDLLLPQGEATRLALGRLNKEFLGGLRKLFPDFDRYPLPAQRGLVDMAYNLGVGKLEKTFPNFVDACRRGDFGAAADECKRSSSRKERNDATQALFREAAQLNATVRTFTREIRS